MEADKRWTGQILRHLQFKGEMAAAGKETTNGDIELPLDIMNVLRSSFPDYENVVFIDLETTGLNPEKDMITQLAAVNITLPNAHLRTFNVYVKPDNGISVPEKIREMTGITDELLDTLGKSEEKALSAFGEWLMGESFIFAGHNVQFDLCFMMEAIKRHGQACGSLKNALDHAGYFDTLTVYKDRRPSPHNLHAALTEYGSTFVSHHHALEDAGGAFALAYFMGCEKNDLRTYINRIGINPKYGLTGYEIRGIQYYMQEGVQSPEKSSPAKDKSR